MCETYQCHYMRAAIRQLRTRHEDDTTRNQALRDLFPHVSFPDDKLLSRQSKNLINVMSRKWNKRQEYLEKFGVGATVKLAKKVRQQHTTGTCNACLIHASWEALFPTRSPRSMVRKVVRRAALKALRNTSTQKPTIITASSRHSPAITTTQSETGYQPVAPQPQPMEAMQSEPQPTEAVHTEPQSMEEVQSEPQSMPRPTSPHRAPTAMHVSVAAEKAMVLQVLEDINRRGWTRKFGHSYLDSLIHVGLVERKLTPISSTSSSPTL